MGPVLLLNVRVVVLVVSSASSKLDGLFSVREVSKQVMVQELRAVVRIKPFGLKGKSLFNIFYLFENIRLSFAPYVSLLSPYGGDINAVYGECKHAGHRVAAVSNSISLHKPRARLVPLIGFDGDMFT